MQDFTKKDDDKSLTDDVKVERFGGDEYEGSAEYITDIEGGSVESAIEHTKDTEKDRENVMAEKEDTMKEKKYDKVEKEDAKNEKDDSLKDKEDPKKNKEKAIQKKEDAEKEKEDPRIENKESDEGASNNFDKTKGLNKNKTNGEIIIDFNLNKIKSRIKNEIKDQDKKSEDKNRRKEMEVNSENMIKNPDDKNIEIKMMFTDKKQDKGTEDKKELESKGLGDDKLAEQKTNESGSVDSSEISVIQILEKVANNVNTPFNQTNDEKTKVKNGEEYQENKYKYLQIEGGELLKKITEELLEKVELAQKASEHAVFASQQIAESAVNATKEAGAKAVAAIHNAAREAFVMIIRALDEPNQMNKLASNVSPGVTSMNGSAVFVPVGDESLENIPMNNSAFPFTSSKTKKPMSIHKNDTMTSFKEITDRNMSNSDLMLKETLKNGLNLLVPTENITLEENTVKKDVIFDSSSTVPNTLSNTMVKNTSNADIVINTKNLLDAVLVAEKAATKAKKAADEASLVAKKAQEDADLASKKALDAAASLREIQLAT